MIFELIKEKIIRYENEWRLICDMSSQYFDPKDIFTDFWTYGKVVEFIRSIMMIMEMKISEEDEKNCEYAKLAGIPVIRTSQPKYGLKINKVL